MKRSTMSKLLVLIIIASMVIPLIGYFALGG